MEIRFLILKNRVNTEFSIIAYQFHHDFLVNVAAVCVTRTRFKFSTTPISLPTLLNSLHGKKNKRKGFQKNSNVVSDNETLWVILWLPDCLGIGANVCKLKLVASLSAVLLLRRFYLPLFFQRRQFYQHHSSVSYDLSYLLCGYGGERKSGETICRLKNLRERGRKKRLGISKRWNLYICHRCGDVVAANTSTIWYLETKSENERKARHVNYFAVSAAECILLVPETLLNERGFVKNYQPWNFYARISTHKLMWTIRRNRPNFVRKSTVASENMCCVIFWRDFWKIFGWAGKVKGVVGK